MPKPMYLAPHQHVKPSLPTIGIFGIRTASVCKTPGVLNPYWISTPPPYLKYGIYSIVSSGFWSFLSWFRAA